MENKISFVSADGEKIELFALEETKFGGETFLLASDSEDDEAVAYILRQVKKEATGELTYEFVEDEKIINAVAGIFEELLDGEVDLVAEDED